MFLRSSQRNKKKNEKDIVTTGHTISERTESLQWRNTEIPDSKSSANFLRGTVSPISMDSPEFIRALMITSISIGKFARGTLWRWNLTRSSPEQILSMLSNCRMDRSRCSPMHPIFNDTKLSELCHVDFPSLSPSSSAYLNKWMAFERSGSNDLLAFIGIETAQKILQQASIANDSDELVHVSISLQGALILGAILTTRRSEMLLSMSFSIWTLMQVAHSQTYEFGFEKKRVWSILNGLTTKGGGLCGLNQLSTFLDLSLPCNMKRGDRQTLLNSLHNVLHTRSEEGEAAIKDTSKGNTKIMVKRMKIDEKGEKTRRVYETMNKGVQIRGKKMNENAMDMEEQDNISTSTINSDFNRASRVREKVTRFSIYTRVPATQKLQFFLPATQAPLSSPRSYDKEEESDRVKKMEGRTSVDRLERERGLNIRSSTRMSPLLRERMHSLSPPKLERFSPVKKSNDVNGFVSSRDGDYLTPIVSPSGFNKLYMTREDTPHGDENHEKMGRKRRSDNWRRIEEVPEGGSPKGSTSHGDESNLISKRRRTGRYSAKSAGNEILGMFYELRMKREEEWEMEMERISRPMRAKRPVKLFDPTPMTPKKRCSSKAKVEPSDYLDVTSTETIADARPEDGQMDNSEDDENEGRKGAEDDDYEIENTRRKRRWNDRMDGNKGITTVEGEYVNHLHSIGKEGRQRTIKNKTPIWKELPIKIPPLINVNGVIQFGERTEEAVEGMIEYERRMDERNENDNDDIGMEVIHYSGPLDEHSYAIIRDRDTIDEEIVDVVTVDGVIDLEENGKSFEMDEDVEEIHEIIDEQGGDEHVNPPMDMDEY